MTEPERFTSMTQIRDGVDAVDRKIVELLALRGSQFTCEAERAELA